MDTDNLTSTTAEQIPVPSAQTIFLGGIFTIAVLTVCNLAAEIILPIVLAFILNLVFQPLMRIFAKAKIPSALAAIVLIAGLILFLFGLGVTLSGPANTWTQRLPIVLPQIQHKLVELQSPFKGIQGALHNAETVTTSVTTTTSGSVAPAVVVQNSDSTFLGQLLKGTRNFASGLFQTILILFFLLMSGDTFLRRLVEVLPNFHEKKRAVGISQQVESDMSRYLATITLMNLGVGILTTIIMYFTDTGDAILWGTFAFLLNYIPILGPLTNTVILSVVELTAKDNIGEALLPVGLYFLVHLLEGQIVTPMLLAKRFTINPVLVVLALVFWYWMWGIPGAILATPLLVVTKIVFDRIDSLKGFGHFMEG